MAVNPEKRNLDEYGHTHEATIIPFPINKPVDSVIESPIIEEDNKSSMISRAGFTLTSVYAALSVGIPAYGAYESLVGKDLLYANTIGGIALTGTLAMCASALIQKIRR